MERMPQSVEECPVCGERDFTKLTTPGHPMGLLIFFAYLSTFGRCRCECGLDFANPRRSTQLLNQVYASDSYDCHKLNTSVT
jgi:hypothetical protein